VRAYVVTSVLAAAVLLALFSAARPWADVGLAGHALAEGAPWALLLVSLVACGYLLGAAVPATRALFLDRRVEEARRRAVAYQVLVRIPLGTVFLEEVAFRGVLYGLVWQTYGPVLATVVSCALFGLWHVLPALDVVKLNRVAGRAFRAQPALFGAAAVLAAMLAGLVLCELRRRTGSLLPGIALHWATNGLGYLTGVLINRKVTMATDTAAARSVGRRAGTVPPRPAPPGHGRIHRTRR
jgi:membrane protease YdiL (CAAX protease family)